MRELEEKYKAAMMTSAQLDNEKQSLVYQVSIICILVSSTSQTTQLLYQVFEGL